MESMRIDISGHVWSTFPDSWSCIISTMRGIFKYPESFNVLPSIASHRLADAYYLIFRCGLTSHSEA